jgi:hypothetical protein
MAQASAGRGGTLRSSWCCLGHRTASRPSPSPHRNHRVAVHHSYNGQGNIYICQHEYQTKEARRESVPQLIRIQDFEHGIGSNIPEGFNVGRDSAHINSTLCCTLGQQLRSVYPLCSRYYLLACNISEIGSAHYLDVHELYLKFKRRSAFALMKQIHLLKWKKILEEED